MRAFAKIFALLMFLTCANVEAAILEKNSDEMFFRELKTRILIPMPPERIRHRKDGHKLQKPNPRQIEVPPRRPPKQPERYTQRQPKRPPFVRAPRLPQRHSPPRGSNPPKRFNPPRF